MKKPDLMSFAFNRGVGSKKIVEHKNNTKMGFWGHIKQQLTNLMSFAFNRGVGSKGPSRNVAIFNYKKFFL